MGHTLHAAEGDRAVTASLGLSADPVLRHRAGRASGAALGLCPAHGRPRLVRGQETPQWLGRILGAQLPDDAAAEAVLEQPEAAEGIVTVLSSHPRQPSQLRELSLREAVAQL